MSLLYAFILLVVAAASIPVGRRLTGDYFSPPALFVSTWSATFALFELRMLPYPPLNAATLGLIVGTMALVGGGAFLGMRARFKSPDERALPDTLANRWVTAYACVGLLGTVWFLTSVSRTLGWSALRTPFLVRAALGEHRLSSTYLFLELVCIATPLLAASLTLTGVRLNRLATAGAIACALATWFSTDRTQFFTVALGIFFMYVFRRASEVRWRGVMAAGLVLAAALTSNFLIIGALMGKTPENLGVTMQLPSAALANGAIGMGDPSSLALARLPSTGIAGRVEKLLTRGSTLYLYATASYGALNVLVNEPPPLTRGLHSAYPVFRALQRLGVIQMQLPEQIPEFVPLGLRADTDISFNGFTFLYYPLMDFGVIGALLYAGAIGVFAGFVYRLAVSYRTSPLGLLIMAHLSIALILSVFVNKFNNTASWYVAAATLGPILLHSIRRPRTVGAQPLTN